MRNPQSPDRVRSPLVWIIVGLCAGVLAGPLTANPLAVPAPQVVVLVDGQVLFGIVSETPGGYRIDIGDTHFVVPFERVRLTAESLAAAHELLRDALREPTAEDHLVLAEWCLKQNLVDQAKQEVTAALKLEPLRSDARALLARVDERLGTKTTTSRVVRVSSESAKSAMETPHTLIPADLSPQGFQDFMRQVQPLLMNKCGNAACHGGGAKNAFRLVPARLGTAGHRYGTEQNLEMVFRFLDFSDPLRSPLLVKPAESTDVHRDLFLGPRRAPQFDVFRDWVMQLTETPVTVQEATTAKERSHRDALPVASTVSTSATTPASSPPPAHSEPKPLRPSISSREPDEKLLLERIRQEQSPDPFDPEVFNRRVHGMTAREYRERGTLAK